MTIERDDVNEERKFIYQHTSSLTKNMDLWTPIEHNVSSLDTIRHDYFVRIIGPNCLFTKEENSEAW